MKEKFFLKAKTLPLPAQAALPLFAHLSEFAVKEGQGFYQSELEQFSLGVISSAICILGKENNFEIRALSQLGKQLLVLLSADLPGTLDTDAFCGQFPIIADHAKLSERLEHHPVLMLIRQLLIPIQASLPNAFNGGLFGVFAYDLVKQFEKIPDTRNDLLDEPDYLFYLPETFFIIDQKAQENYLVAVYADEGMLAEQKLVDLQRMRQAPLTNFPVFHSSILQSDTSREEYESHVRRFQEHILAGDIFQGVYGRMEMGECSGNPFSVFAQICKINPSPYQFYLRTRDGAIFGASPELAVKVHDEKGHKKISLSPIAGSRPVSFDSQQNIRQQIRLRTDNKELAEHVMLIDLARNDIASIAKPGTTTVDEAFGIKQYSHIQHLVSSVSGNLQDQYDALDAYFATMNMGTLTGAPKLRAMQLIAKYETNRRGFFGGGFGVISASGQMNTCIVIRSIRVKHGKIYLRAGAGIVADSHPQSEYEETEHKMAACKQALALANQGVV